MILASRALVLIAALFSLPVQAEQYPLIPSIAATDFFRVFRPNSVYELYTTPAGLTAQVLKGLTGPPGSIVYFTGASTWAASAPLASGQLVQGGGAGVAPSTFSLGGDCTLASPNVTCTKTAGVPFGTLATLNAAPAGTLTGNTLAPGVTASSLTSLGTLTSLSVPTELPGLSPSVESSGYPGLDFNPCTSLSTCTWFLFQRPTNQTAVLQSPLYVQRNTNALTGTCPSCGTTSTVPAALNVIDFAGRNDVSWNGGVAVQLFNSSLGTGLSEDVAGLFYAIKQNSTGGGEVGSTWGMNSYCYDQQPTVNPVYTCIGAEHDVYVVAGGGADTTASRVALNIVGGVFPGTDAAVHVGTGFQISTVGGATMDRGISYFAGTYGSLMTTRGGTVAAINGIDWSAATFSGFLIKAPNLLIDNAGGYLSTPVTVASLPSCTSGLKGTHRVVSDASSPTYNATAVGGGAITRPVICDGALWKT